MRNENAEELIREYLAGTATPEEEALLESWYIEAAQAQPALCGELEYSKIEYDILGSLRGEQRARPKVIKVWPRIAAAAVAFIVLCLGSLFIPRETLTPSTGGLYSQKNELLPAATRAHLTLPDGRMITLDSARSGPLERQDDATISSQGGQLIYSVSQADLSAGQGPTAYHTLTTLPGEHFSLLLADGTKAWLNAASSITYPVVFNGNERKVRVTGEVYFEIVHLPFSFLLLIHLVGLRGEPDRLFDFGGEDHGFFCAPPPTRSIGISISKGLRRCRLKILRRDEYLPKGSNRLLERGRGKRDSRSQKKLGERRVDCVQRSAGRSWQWQACEYFDEHIHEHKNKNNQGREIAAGLEISAVVCFLKQSLDWSPTLKYKDCGNGQHPNGD